MKIVLIGSGNVATHLGEALVQHGHQVLQVYSRQLEHAEMLAKRLATVAVDTVGTDRLDALEQKADLYLICVSDQAIRPVIEQLPRSLAGIVAHTSGSTPMAVFDPCPTAYGVFYPVQTFSKEKSIDFRQVPLALEASDAATYSVLESLATGLSDRVFACDSARRQAIHVAAVFACNFTNYLYAVGEEVLRRHGLCFDLIRPLIQETAEKVQQYSPATVQTGPAVRKDLVIIQRHLDFLEEETAQGADPGLRELYIMLSSLIDRGIKPE